MLMYICHMLSQPTYNSTSICIMCNMVQKSLPYRKSFSESHLSLINQSRSNRDKRAAGSWMFASADLRILYRP